MDKKQLGARSFTLLTRLRAYSCHHMFSESLHISQVFHVASMLTKKCLHFTVLLNRNSSKWEQEDELRSSVKLNMSDGFRRNADNDSHIQSFI